jgi:MFS family permease
MPGQCGFGSPGPYGEVGSVTHTRAPVAVWRSVRSLPDFWRLLELRTASQFGDGLFQAGLAGALLFNPERAVRPLAIAGAFAVLFLPYSLLGPFAGALMDRWDRRLVLVGANLGRLVAVALVGVCWPDSSPPACPPPCLMWCPASRSSR